MDNSILTNPVVLAVILMLILSFLRVHVVLSLLISAFAGGLLATVPDATIRSALKLEESSSIGMLEQLQYIIQAFERGIRDGTTTALSYAVLGAFAVALSYSGLTQSLANTIIQRAKKGSRDVKWWLLGAIAAFSVSSQNLIPVHIAFIPLLIPPLLSVINHLHMDRRVVACLITFGLNCTYMFIPYGFGDIFLNKIILPNVNQYGMDVSGVNVYVAMGIPAAGMLLGLLIAMFYTYRQPRQYQDLPIEGGVEALEIKKSHIAVAVFAVIVAFLAQKYTGSLIFAGVLGFAILMSGRVVQWQKADTVFNSGIRFMSMIAFTMISANGFAAVMHATGAIQPLIESSIQLFGANKGLMTLAMLLVGLLITMGIGSTFSTIPILAAIYVPLCLQLGFSPVATVALIGTAGILGDAGSPASDSTLGPTMGLNADGQHNHMRDTVIPTFIHFNIPLIAAGWVAAMIL